MHFINLNVVDDNLLFFWGGGGDGRANEYNCVSKSLNNGKEYGQENLKSNLSCEYVNDIKYKIS